MIGRIALAALGAVAIGACAIEAAPGDSAPPTPGTPVAHKCDNANIQQFVGKQRSTALEHEMLRISGAAFVRWAPAGTAITMEFRSDRLTVFLDASNRVERISCS